MVKDWRSGAIVERKKLNQWFFNISKFSENLLDGLNSLENWPKKVKIMQTNWIGKSFGCEIDFKIKVIFLLIILNVLQRVLILCLVFHFWLFL